MAMNGLFCADVLLRNYSLTHSLTLSDICSFLSYNSNFLPPLTILTHDVVDYVLCELYCFMNLFRVTISLESLLLL